MLKKHHIAALIRPTNSGVMTLVILVTGVLSIHWVNSSAYCFSLFHLTEADRPRVSVSKQSDNEMTAGKVEEDNTESLGAV